MVENLYSEKKWGYLSGYSRIGQKGQAMNFNNLNNQLDTGLRTTKNLSPCFQGLFFVFGAE